VFLTFTASNDSVVEVKIDMVKLNFEFQNKYKVYRKYIFQGFTKYREKRHWSVVLNDTFIPFFVNRDYISSLPLRRKGFRSNGKLKISQEA